jgi:hypothetical protein
MALEDFTIYTEVDEGGDITVAANAITVDTIRRDATSYVKYAYPASTFGNFVHKFDFNFTAATDTGLCCVWQVSNSSNTFNEGLTNNEGLAAYLAYNAPATYSFGLWDYSDDGTVSKTWASAPGQRYVRIQRNGTELIAIIYTDAAMTTIESTLVLTVPNTAYANIYPVASRDAAPTATPTISCVVSNLDLQFASAVTVTVTAGTFGVGLKARSSVVAPPTQQARKPYLSLKQSMREFFSAHVRWIRESATKESAFEKPYLSSDYPSMHFEIPTPDWPTTPPGKGGWPPGTWRPGAPPGGGARPVPGCPGCALYADPPLDCEHPVEIHSGIWCTNTPGAQTSGLTTTKANPFNKTVKDGIETVKLNPWAIKFAGNPAITDAKVNGVTAGDTKLEIYAKKGVIKDITIGAWASIGVSAAVFVDSSIVAHTICGSMIDGAGSNCMACIDVNCACNCTTITTMTLDAANTDTTIAPGGTASITVLDGCGPFTWSVSGAGYVLSSLSTEGRSNTLTSATGTCGTTYKSFALVTVVDDCGTSVTCTIKNTAAGWTFFGYMSAQACYVGATCYCDEANYSGTYYYTSTTSWPWKVLGYYCSSCATTGGQPLVCGTKSTCVQNTTGGCGSITVIASDIGFPGGPTNCWGECAIGIGLEAPTRLYYWECGAESCASAGGSCT